MHASRITHHASLVYEWEWDASHHPLPLTPAFGSVYPGWLGSAMRAMFAEFGLLPETVEMTLRDGYPFTRVKPVALPITPPRWLLGPALRLWRLHPTVATRVRRAVRRMREDHSATVLTAWETRWRPAIAAEQRAFRDANLDALDAAELADHIERLMRRTGHWVTVHFLLHGAIAIPLMRLRNLLGGQHAAGVLMAELVQGSSPASSAPARALSRAAATLRGDPRALDAAERGPTDAALRKLREDAPAFDRSFRAFLDRYGQGIVGRYEFAVPTLGERPESLLPAILRAARNSDTAENPGADDRIDEVIGRSRDRDEDTIRAIIAAARRAYAIRDENVQITFVDAFGLCRLALLAAGRRLRDLGRLGTPDDVFFLTVAETLATLRGDVRPLKDTVEERRRTWLTALQRPPERGHGRRLALPDFARLPAEARELHEAVIGYLREIMAAPDVYPEATAEATVIRGVGAVRGHYAGRARVLRSEDDFDRLRPGDVLVCPMTSPAWAVALPLAGALVTDHGGILSHPAVIAREFGIPAVVATRRATTAIRDGATVEVDGDAGVVRIVAE